MNAKPKLSVVKIGGNIVDSPAALETFLSDFYRLEGPKALVHGGGAMASKIATQLGIETRMVEGRRITDEETLKIVAMVYAGWINKSIVAALQKTGCNVIGLSSADTNCISAKRRYPNPIDFGFVGDPIPESVNTAFIAQLIESGITPVFCAVTHDGNGSLLNTNADTIASVLAVALSERYAVSLYYCFGKEGVLQDVNNPDSLIPSMNLREYAIYKRQGIIADGMIPKLDSSFKAIVGGVSEVIILHAKNVLKKRGTILTMS